MRKPVFAANWKMNKGLGDIAPFVSQFSKALQGISGDFEVLLAPVSLHIPELAKALQGQPYQLAAQNCGTAKSGAFTGEVAPVMLKELGCNWTLLGHSERRHVFKEDDSLVLARLKAAIEGGLKVVLCVGELLEERKAGTTNKVVERQLSVLKEVPGLSDLGSSIVVAYEPVWAIGTGETATSAQAQEVHAFIRQWLGTNFSAEKAETVRILYGGSVKPDNSGELLANRDVDGVLVGGASLDPATFAGVVKNGLESVA